MVRHSVVSGCGYAVKTVVARKALAVFGGNGRAEFHFGSLLVSRCCLVLRWSSLEVRSRKGRHLKKVRGFEIPFASTTRLQFQSGLCRACH